MTHSKTIPRLMIFTVSVFSCFVLTPAGAQTLNPSRDAYLRAGTSAGTNHGTATQLIVKNDGPTANNTRESWLAFDISSVSGTVGTARLRVYLSQVNDPTVHSVYGAGDSWTETGITWNNQPSSSSTALSSQSLVTSQANSWIEYDVTALVASQVAASASQVSFVMRANNGGYTVYHSREAANKPQLIITPVTQTVLTDRDAFIRAGTYSGTNHGSINQLVVKNDGPTANNTRESWVGFNIANLTGPLASAKLRVYLNQINDPTTHSVYAGDDNWTEGGITWSNQPTSYSPALASAALVTGQASSWIEYDVTSWVADKVAASASSVSFAIAANNGAYSVYHSREAANAPRLFIRHVYNNHADLQAALDAAQPGDVIEFTGTINGVLITQNSGTSSSPITLRGVGNAVIQGAGVSTSAYGVRCDHQWYVFENFKITNVRKGFVAQYGANNGILRNIVVDTVGDEAFKFRWNTRYWLVENCVARNTGNHSGTYGEGFYVGNANNNWVDPNTPDATGYITFLNCLAEDLVNDGFDVKEGSSNVKIIGCTVDFRSGQPTGGATHGDSGIYLRAENVQVINTTVIGQTNGGAAIKLQRVTTASDGNGYGSNYHIYGCSISQSSGGSGLLHVKNEAAVRNSTYLYTNYNLNGGDLYVSGSANAISTAPSSFSEITWSGPGGGVYAP